MPRSDMLKTSNLVQSVSKSAPVSSKDRPRQIALIILTDNIFFFFCTKEYFVISICEETHHPNAVERNTVIS